MCLGGELEIRQRSISVPKREIFRRQEFVQKSTEKKIVRRKNLRSIGPFRRPQKIRPLATANVAPAAGLFG